MRWALDTTTLSALMKGQAMAIQRLRAARRRDVLLPQPVLAEVAYGLARMPVSRARRTLQERFSWFARELPRADWSDEVSARFGWIKAELERRGARLEDFDVAIAAHALVHDATLVTSNLKHMQRVPGLAIADWTTGNPAAD